MSSDGVRIDNVGWVGLSPGPPSSPCPDGVGSECTSHRGKTPSWHHFLAVEGPATSVAGPGCCLSGPYLCPQVPCRLHPVRLCLLLSPSPPVLPGRLSPALSHEPLLDVGGLFEHGCLSIVVPPPCPTPEGALMPPCGGRHAPAHSSWFWATARCAVAQTTASSRPLGRTGVSLPLWAT